VTFVEEALPSQLNGMNSGDMIQYVKYVADHLLETMNLRKLYKVINPFEWMNMISLSTKSNFFERRNTNYKKPESRYIFSEDF